jgi:hypothetical protein
MYSRYGVVGGGEMRFYCGFGGSCLLVRVLVVGLWTLGREG